MQYIRFYTIIVLISVAVIIGAIHFKYYKETFFRYFHYYLCYSLLGEYVALALIKTESSGSNIIYNLYAFVSVVFLSFFFRHYMKNKVYRKITLGLILIFIVCSIINSLFYENFISNSQTNTWILEYLIEAIVIIMFLADLLRSDAILKMKDLPQFWVSIGYFITALCFIPVLVIARFVQWTGVYDYILLGVNVISVLCIIKAFLVTKKNYSDEISKKAAV